METPTYPNYEEIRSKMDWESNFRRYYTKEAHESCRKIFDAYHKRDIDAIRNEGILIQMRGGCKEMLLCYNTLYCYSSLKQNARLLQTAWDEIGDWNMSLFLQGCYVPT